MVRLASFVLLATSLVASSSPLRPRTAAQLEADLNSIISSVTTLDSAIKNLSSAGFAGIGPIETDTQTVLNNLQTAISQASATGSLDLTDGQAILALTEQLQTLITTTLTDLDNAAPELVADNAVLPGILTLIKTDLSQLSGNTTILENTLLTNAPAQLKPSATVVIDGINAAFSSAIAVYATAA